MKDKDGWQIRMGDGTIVSETANKKQVITKSFVSSRLSNMTFFDWKNNPTLNYVPLLKAPLNKITFKYFDATLKLISFYTYP
jgi:hypothetical protein